MARAAFSAKGLLPLDPIPTRTCCRLLIDKAVKSNLPIIVLPKPFGQRLVLLALAWSPSACMNINLPLSLKQGYGQIRRGSYSFPKLLFSSQASSSPPFTTPGSSPWPAPLSTVARLFVSSSVAPPTRSSWCCCPSATLTMAPRSRPWSASRSKRSWF